MGKDNILYRGHNTDYFLNIINLVCYQIYC